MILRKLFRSKPKVQGAIGYYRLADWWLDTLSPSERQTIEKRYGNITQGDYRPGIKPATGPVTATDFLTGVASSLKANERHIARRILRHAEPLSSNAPVLDRHFLYSQMIEANYRERDNDPSAYDEAIYACEQQIKLSRQAANEFRKQFSSSDLPRHRGYEQLAIIREKEGKLDEAIGLSKQARKEGWSGDWNKRIERYDKKRDKLAASDRN
jgi:hypothetical protein